MLEQSYSGTISCFEVELMPETMRVEKGEEFCGGFLVWQLLGISMILQIFGRKLQALAMGVCWSLALGAQGNEVRGEWTLV